MREPLFNKGDIARIRDWKDMAAEYGEDFDGTIKVPLGFVTPMRGYCGLEREVLATQWDLPHNTYRVYMDNVGGWSYSEEMLEPPMAPLEDSTNVDDNINALFGE